jgi:hypothetical protein
MLGAAFACGARRCGTSEPPNMLLEPCDGVGRWAAGAVGRGADFAVSGAGGISPAPRGRGPAMKVVWGGRPHCT